MVNIPTSILITAPFIIVALSPYYLYKWLVGEDREPETENAKNGKKEESGIQFVE